MINRKTFPLLAMTVVGMTITSSAVNAQAWGPPHMVPHYGPPPIYRAPLPVYVPVYDPYAAELKRLALQRAAEELVRQQGIVCFHAPCSYSNIADDPQIVRKKIRRIEEVEEEYR